MESEYKLVYLYSLCRF